MLHKRSIGETDCIVTLYTRQKGKLSTVAKGARRPVSRLAGATELFTYGRFFLAVGRGLDIITQAEIQESFPRIRVDLDRIAYAAYLAELTNTLVEERDANCDMFDTLLSALYLLESGVDPGLIARYYELQTMSLMGYHPELAHCVRCGADNNKPDMMFSPSLGGRVCDRCGPRPEDAIHLRCESVVAMQQILTSEPSKLKSVQLSPAVRDELQKAVKWFVRYHTGQEIKSSEFIQALSVPNRANTD